MSRNREKTDYDYLMEELNDARKYTIKNICFLCRIKIKNSFKYFQMYGNCCVVCSARVSKVSSKFKFRPDKRAEALEELEDRRRLVRKGILKKQEL